MASKKLTLPELYARSKQHVAEMRDGMNSLAWAQLPPPKQRLNPRDRLGRSPKGTPGRRMVSVEEVAVHNDLSKDGWTIYENKVYSISRYASYHPGGYYVLAAVTGDDCTSQFNELHPWIQCHAMLKDYYIGDLLQQPKPKPKTKTKTKGSQVQNGKQLPVLTRGLTGWMKGRCTRWEVLSQDKSIVLMSFEAMEDRDREAVEQQNTNKENPKHVMFKLGQKFVRAYSNLITAWPDQEKNLMPIQGLDFGVFEQYLVFSSNILVCSCNNVVCSSNIMIQYDAGLTGIADPKQIHLVIRLYKKGRLTKLLHKKIVEGSEIVGDFAYVKSHVRFVEGEIKEDGDRGDWTVASNNLEHLVLVCAGTGVLPLLAFIQQCLYERINKRDAPKLWLFYASASEETIIFHEWLKQLAKKYKDWFNVVFVVSNALKKWKGKNEWQTITLWWLIVAVALGEVGHLGDDIFARDWSTLAWTNAPDKNVDEVATNPNGRVVLSGPPGFDKYGPMDVAKLTNIPTCLVKKGFNPEFIFSM